MWAVRIGAFSALFSACATEGALPSTDTDSPWQVSTGDSGGPTTTSRPPVLEVVALPHCAEGVWTYHAETAAWTPIEPYNLLNVWATTPPVPWNEEHTLPSIDFGNNNRFDVLERTLVGGADPVLWTPDVDTVFQCGVDDQSGLLTYAIRVYDIDHNFADCAIWGYDAVGMTFAENRVEPYAITRPDELSACAVWTP